MDADLFLREIYRIGKRLEEMRAFNKKLSFNHTEIQAINEISAAKREGRRMRSCELSDVLGISRSAVSQMLNKLERKGIVRREADEQDRKAAYIELCEEAAKACDEVKGRVALFLKKLTDQLGQDAPDEFFDRTNRFADACGEVFREMTKADGCCVAAVLAHGEKE